MLEGTKHPVVFPSHMDIRSPFGEELLALLPADSPSRARAEFVRSQLRVVGDWDAAWRANHAESAAAEAEQELHRINESATEAIDLAIGAFKQSKKDRRGFIQWMEDVVSGPQDAYQDVTIKDDGYDELTATFKFNPASRGEVSNRAHVLQDTFKTRLEKENGSGLALFNAHTEALRQRNDRQNRLTQSLLQDRDGRLRSRAESVRQALMSSLNAHDLAEIKEKHTIRTTCGVSPFEGDLPERSSFAKWLRTYSCNDHETPPTGFFLSEYDSDREPGRLISFLVKEKDNLSQFLSEEQRRELNALAYLNQRCMRIHSLPGWPIEPFYDKTMNAFREAVEHGHLLKADVQASRASWKSGLVKALIAGNGSIRSRLLLFISTAVIPLLRLYVERLRAEAQKKTQGLPEKSEKAPKKRAEEVRYERYLTLLRLIQFVFDGAMAISYAKDGSQYKEEDALAQYQDTRYRIAKHAAIPGAIVVLAGIVTLLLDGASKAKRFDSAKGTLKAMSYIVGLVGRLYGASAALGVGRGYAAKAF